MSNKDKTYEPEKLERQIQQFWNENEMFSVTEDPEKEKFFCLISITFLFLPLEAALYTWVM